MECNVIIVAGGTGSRMKSELPKQLIPVLGKPIIYYTVNQFIKSLPQAKIIVVCHKDYLQETENALNSFSSITYTTGGVTRFDSVRKGLEKVPNSGLVLIHDAARCTISVNLIKQCYEACLQFQSAIPLLPVKDSYRQWKQGQWQNTNRDELRIVQTPQCFNTATLKDLIAKTDNNEFTDEASLFDYFQVPLHFITGEAENIKVTNPSDLLFVEKLLQ
jgi:2-C-methyl-D-erythritol 4-phosphate cytidylyltransferase